MTTKGNTPRLFSHRQIKQHNQPKPPKTTWRKRTRKKTEQENEWKFYFFDERTYFNELDQSTPLSDNYKNSEICKH